MVTTELAKSLQQALKAHRDHLNKHLQIWRKVQLEHARDSEIASAAESCEQRTLQMLEQCSTVDFLKLSDDTGKTGVKKSNKRSKDVEDLPKAKKARKDSGSVENAAEPSISFKTQHFPITKDPSGLFMIDSNPARPQVLEEVPKDQAKQKKHKRGYESNTEEEYVDAPLEIGSSEEEQSTPKRKKARKSDPIQGPVDEEDEYVKSLSQKVVLRLKEKDEFSKKKANKKRKRESDASVQEFQSEAGPSTRAPPTKKQKGKVVVENTQPDPSKIETSKKLRKKRAAKVKAKDAAQAETKKKDKSAA